MSSTHSDGATTPTPAILVVLAWLIVALPLAYGLYQTLVKAFQLLSG